ncbi:hypothetical protein GIB67_023550 [Kingdonia uniflora]|uniref:Uncharacterized protein n=1 Tax=Kingdonia uniflora TaxID=39325 RepID=A0A7J7PA24_9MAGN|nr:hypothetical protein GIB67_023550 [Kingdonia uniflora]
MATKNTYRGFPLGSGNLEETTQLAPKGFGSEYSSNLLQLVTMLDLSEKSLSGEIPYELTRLLGLRFLILSRNCFTGNIPEEIGAMGLLLESLDLSRNQITGVIPQSMSNLTSLSYLDLSYNKLSGKIPTGSQLQRFTESSYVSNDGLCGPPLKEICGREGSSDTPTTEDQDGDENATMELFYLAVAPGFVLGLAGFCAVLVFMDSWKIAYFRFIEDTKDRLLACFH